MVSKKVVPQTEPAEIKVDGRKKLRTTINEETKKHHVICDLCGADFTLTVATNPWCFFDHRGSAGCTNQGATQEQRRQKAAALATATGSISGLGQAVLSHMLPRDIAPLLGRQPQHHKLIETLSTLQTSIPTPHPQVHNEQPSPRTTVADPIPCPGISIEWTPGSIWDSYPYLQHSYRDVGWEPIGFESTGLYGMHKALLAKMRTQIIKLRTKDVLRRKLTDHQRIMMLLASDDVPGLRRILLTALKWGASPQVVYSLLEQAIAGLFSAWGGFTDRDLDISFLVKAIGGPRLLYALQKSHGLASRSIILHNQTIPQLQASIAIPSRDEINANISALLNPLIKPPPSQSGHEKLVGHAVMFDGVALETKCRYCPRRNVILGLCREHSHWVNTQVTDLQSIEDIRAALFSPATKDEKVCFGSDATVVAIAPYGRDNHYTPSPIVVSPSDKTEKGLELAKWMQTMIDSWQENENGESVHGPIWALASDGDAAYRLAKQTLCMVKQLDPKSDLGKILYPLIGLNLLTSIGNIIWTGDPKHIWKRFGTLAQNPLGVMIFLTNIKPENIIQHLCELDEMTEEKARQLLDPADKQNIPKAVGLIQQLAKLGELPIPRNPKFAHKRNSIVFFAELLGYFVFPFISVEMDLSEQVRSLATYAHLSVALQLKHGSACFTGPLYADSQATIKNIIFTIVCMQLISPNLRFWILHEGTDRLELIFSDCRTLDHTRNFDIDQLASKLSLSALISAAFQRNPDLDRGHRRLSLKGQNAANHILIKYFGPGAQVDFIQIFSDKGRDFLRPLGTPPAVPTPRHTEEHDVTISSGSDGTTGRSEQLHDISGNPLEEPLGMDLNDFLPDSIQDMDADKPSPAADKFLQASDGRKYLKSSLVASLSSNRTKKVTMCTLQAQGVALEDLQKRKSSELDLLNLADENVMKAGDLAGTLFCSGDKVCLAVLMVKGFRIGKDKAPCTVIEMDKLDNAASNIRIIAQVMELENPRTSASLTSPGEDFWEWTGNFMMLDVDATNLRLTHHQLIIEVSSVVVHPLGPSVATRTSFNKGVHAESSNKPTWCINSEQLDEVMKGIWQSLDPESPEMLENLQLLPYINNPQALPYSDSIGQQSFFIRNIPPHLTPKPKLPGKTIVQCLICGIKQSLHKMREHVGGHILLSLRGIEAGALITRLTISKEGKHSIKSSCQYHYEKMQYKAAKASSNRSPCTNVPLHCSLCPKSVTGNQRTFWKYNASYHLASEHSADNEKLPVIPRKMMVDIFIHKKEEQQLGITAKVTEDYRRDEGIPDSNAIDAITLALAGTSSPIQGRDCAGTGSTVSLSDAHQDKRAKTSRM
ncbi:hypothetical protein B0H10DRAFT_1947987 [Mycena sp. CBHHK59/15]|nr:hypothetical protein B0H10DRAFT_1947987 [Mycena sp. CBHHK59/15]